MNRLRWRRSGKRALYLTGASVLLASVMLAVPSTVAGGAEAPSNPGLLLPRPVGTSG